MINSINYNIPNYKPSLNSNPYVNLSTASNKVSSLAPLTQDTVSFCGNKKLNSLLMQAFENEQECREVYENADVSHVHLRKTLKAYLDNFRATKQNPQGSIARIESRIKSPESMREKVASELNDDIINCSPRRINPMDTEDIKSCCADAIGARIVLRDSSKEVSKSIIDALIKAIEAGDLKITKIANYRPDDISDDLKYFQDEDIKRLQEAVNRNNKHTDKYVEIQTEAKKTGYMALHLDVDLSNPEFKVKNNGYKGEIQITGIDVEQLKDVEDFCYKIKSGKDIRAGHVAYKPFVEFFSSFIKDKENFPDLESDFVEYTKTAYEIQRKKSPKLNGKSPLPTIEECDMTDKIPYQLDFNNLAALKNACDNVHRAMNPPYPTY